MFKQFPMPSHMPSHCFKKSAQRFGGRLRFLSSSVAGKIGQRALGVVHLAFGVAVPHLVDKLAGRCSERIVHRILRQPGGVVFNIFEQIS